jgi:formylglycine-generating enzyme required for sulfatase activity
MLDNGQRQLVELGDFLTALRVNGVPVGPADIDRLRQLFALEPRLHRDGLKSLLSALLVKTPVQREVFETLFADWCPDHDADWPEEEERARDTHTGQPTAHAPLPQPLPQRLDTEAQPAPPRRRVFRRLLMVMGGVLLGALLTWLLWPAPIVVKQPVEHPVLTLPSPPPGEIGPDDLPATPVPRVWFWQAEVDPKHVHVPRRLGPLELALLGLIALTLALALWWRYRQRFPNIEPTPQRYRGYGWQPLPPPERDDNALIEARDRRQMVWHIEHFVSDDPTHRLNLPQTVDATARAGGFVHLRFQPAVYDRAIWFWLDRQLDRPTPRMAVRQLIATLAAAGLEARQGLFTDVPDRIDWPEQTGYRPTHEEGPGRQALVAIFTDGEGLAHRLDNPLSHQATERLLRSLRRWPRLCFVECATTGARLAPLLAPYGLETITLTELPHWLGGIETREPLAAPLGADLYGDARVWAAAIALGGTPAETASAQSLRVALRLNVSPWLVDQILAEVQHPDAQHRLINWLLRCEPLGDNGLPQPGSLVRRVLDWWQQRYSEAAQRMQAQENPLLPWQDSLASRRWQMEQVLLHLYCEPERAVQQLAYLADDALRDEIHERLATFAAADHRPDGRGDDSAYVYCTWRFADLPAATRHRLRQLGFAAGLFEHEPVPLKHAPRLVLAGTLLVTLALTAFGVAAHRWYTPHRPHLLPQEAVYNHPVLAAQTVRLMEPMASGNYRVTLGSAHQTVWLPTVPAGAEIPVVWEWKDEPNAVRLEDNDSVVLRAGRLAQPIRACSPGWPQRSLVVIAAPFETENPAARQLAIRLLDKGSADQVLLGTDWEQRLEHWLGPSQALNRDTQVLVILPEVAGAEHAAARLANHPGPWAVAWSDDFAGLARKIDFSGSKTVDQVKQMAPRLHVHRTQGQVRVYGGSESIELHSFLAWVHICPGTFTMGTIKGEDTMANQNEIVDPPRTVVLSAFQIAANETLRQQDGEIDGMPAVNFNWQQARAFCESIGGGLPTEAQWEYATRGGSRFPWSFGSDTAQLERYAWFDDNSLRQAHEVKKKLSNSLGLYDMHGNVWEWVQDWYSDYASGVFVDPLGPSSGVLRVGRGGSFNDPPRVLRSATRIGAGPQNWSEYVGVRCVRVPPQP